MTPTFLTNNTKYNNVVNLWAYWDNAFSAEELDKICELSFKTELHEGKFINNDTPTNKDVRNSKVNFHDRNEENFWIFDKINSVASIVNDRFFNFDLTGYDSYQYTEYYGSDLGHYNFHTDMIYAKETPTRKLSMSLLLNDDFDGGDFLINEEREHAPTHVPLTKGRMIFFPSFVLHKVSPVTRGTRKSLVVWITGPKFK
jgi:PKHD-type hydroxylase